MSEFKSKKEMIQAMLDGKTVVFEDGGLGHYDETITYGFVYKISSSGNRETMFSAFDLWQKATTKKEWYEKLDGTEGSAALCWVSDRSDGRKATAKWVYEYRSIETCAFTDTDDISWSYAFPVKPEDLYKE